MANLRSAIPDFQLANPIYSAATVSFYTVNPATGAKTATLATLYAGPTGSTTALNPHPLDGDGKFSAPVYIDAAVIGEVNGASVPSHDTGVIQVRGTWKGDWITATAYSSSDVLRDSATDNVYVVTNDYVSGASVAADVLAGNLELMIDLAPITSAAEGYRDEAEGFRDQAQDAAESASNGSFTDTPTALGYARRNAGNTQYETRTPLQVNDDIAVVGANVSSGSTTDLSAMTGRVANLTGNATINSFGTMADGIERGFICTGAPTLAHSAAIDCPGDVNLVLAAGDYFTVRSLGSGNWKVTGGVRANGQPLFASILIPAASDPLPTVDGDAKWDSDDNILVIGDGSGQKRFLAAPASLAAGDMIYASAAKVLSRVAKSTFGKIWRMNAAADAPEWADAVNLGTAQATTSGTSKDFTSIPPWVREIVVMFSLVSTNGTSDLLIQIGDSGGIENTGYTSASSDGSSQQVQSTAGFIIANANAANSFSGRVVLSLADPDNNVWVASHSLDFANSGFCVFGGGRKALSAVLDRLRITTVSGSPAFDAGLVNINYK